MKTTATQDLHFYLESSLPTGISLSEYRRSRPRPLTRWERLKQLAGSTRVVAATRA